MFDLDSYFHRGFRHYSTFHLEPFHESQNSKYRIFVITQYLYILGQDCPTFTIQTIFRVITTLSNEIKGNYIKSIILFLKHGTSFILHVHPPSRVIFVQFGLD